MSLTERDKKHLWHPLTQHKLQPNTIAISKAKDCILYDDNGNKYIDAIASWYTCMYGHCHDYIITKVYEQMQQLDQIVFSGFTHKPAVELSEALMRILPKNQSKLFFSDNGSTSVEVAIKMALQFFVNKNEKRKVIIAFENGFHGDTFGAMSVSGLSVYNGPFTNYSLEVKRIETPNGNNHKVLLKTLKKIVNSHPVAAFIYEPLVQGAAGMTMYSAEGLDAILAFCKSKKIITIADEVMTGFGKTGRYFASDFIDTKPDIICLSKALTAGLLPMAITSCSQHIYNAFYSNDITKAFFHAHTYTANPLACSAALAGIELLLSENIQKNIAQIIQSHKEFDYRIKKHPKIKSTRQLGIIYAIDLTIETERYSNTRQNLFEFFIKNGVFLRPLGNTIYLVTPYTITKAQLNKIYQVIEAVLETF